MFPEANQNITMISKGSCHLTDSKIFS